MAICELCALLDGAVHFDDRPLRFLFFLFVGLVVALGVGHLVVTCFLTAVRTSFGYPAQRKGTILWPWFTGLFERTLAFVVALADVDGAYAVLIAWMAAKLALNWQRPAAPEADKPVNDKKRPTNDEERRIYGFSALMAGVLSLGIGVIGGIIARCGLCP